MTNRPTYSLTLRAEPDRDGGPPAVIRLRRLLKLALRAFGFKCIEAKELKPSPSEVQP